MVRIFKKTTDKILRAETPQSILAWIVACYIRFVYWWSSFEYLHKDRLEPLALSQKPLIVVFWHNRMVMLPLAWQWKRPFYMLSSRHGISLILTKILSRFGIQSILGSTKRHAIAAGMEIVEKLSSGSVVGITPDGPRGPSQECSAGVIRLAQLAAETLGPVTIIPATYATSRYRRFRSWDRFIFPYPSRAGAFFIGNPIVVTADKDVESLRQALEDTLNICCKEVDSYIKSKDST